MKDKIILKSYIAISTILSTLLILVLVISAIDSFKEKKEKEQKLLVEQEKTALCSDSTSVTTVSPVYSDASLPLTFQYPNGYTVDFSTTTRVDGGGYVPSDKWWNIHGGTGSLVGSVSIKQIKIKNPEQYTAENLLFAKVPAPIGGDALVVYDQTWKRVGDLFVVSQVYDLLSGGYTVVGEPGKEVINEQEGDASLNNTNEYSRNNAYRYLFIYKDTVYVMESYSRCGEAKQLLDNVAKTVKLK